MYNTTIIKIPYIKTEKIINNFIVNSIKLIQPKVVHQLPIIIQGEKIIEIENIVPMDIIIPNGNVTDGYII